MSPTWRFRRYRENGTNGTEQNNGRGNQAVGRARGVENQDGLPHRGIGWGRGQGGGKKVRERERIPCKLRRKSSTLSQSFLTQGMTAQTAGECGTDDTGVIHGHRTSMG